MSDTIAPAAPPQDPATAPKKLTCPLCGLGCDDLVRSASGTVDAKGCAQAAAFFARTPETVSDLIGGKPASFEAAVSEAARLLKAARRPWFGNLASDIAGIQGLLALADQTGGIVDHPGNGVMANFAVVQSKGWMTSTFSEVANRADFVVIIGSYPAASYPRFYERLLRNPHALYRDAAPQVVLLAPASEAALDPAVSRHLIIPQDQILGQIGALKTLLDGHALRAAAPVAEGLADVAAGLKAATYGVIVWDSMKLAGTDSDLAVEILVNLIRDLNLTTRCSGLPLNGRDNGGGLVQALSWQTGFPTRAAFTVNGPDHDPYLYDGTRAAEAGEVDLIVWTGGIECAQPPASTLPLIAFAPHDAEIPGAAVTLRVATAGLDHGGNVVRSDSVVMMPLTAARPSDRRSVATVSAAVLSALKTGGVA